MDQGVENPYKNPALLIADGAAAAEGVDGSSAALKIDPARLLGPRLNGANLYFIGMMGSGKTSVGDCVARRMGSYSFLDTDQIIEKATGMSISEIFATEGEEGFRNVESSILDAVHAYVRCVVSTGGGIVLRNINWAKLQTGIVVWLDVPPDVIYQRIQGTTQRPLLVHQEEQPEDPLQKIRNILESRRDKYSQADLIVHVTQDMDEAAVADLVIRQLHDFIDDHPPAWKIAKAKAQADGLDWVQ